MTLYPWPQTDDAPHAGHLVVWKRMESAPQGLLIDSCAVPLRCMQAPEPADATAIGATPPQAIAARDAALHRVRQVEHLLAVRELKPR